MGRIFALLAFGFALCFGSAAMAEPTCTGSGSNHTRIFTQTGTGLTWTVDSTWNSANNTVVTLTAASNAAVGTASVGGGGGAGGCYSTVSNLALTPGASIGYQVGSPGGTAP